MDEFGRGTEPRAAKVWIPLFEEFHSHLRFLVSGEWIKMVLLYDYVTFLGIYINYISIVRSSILGNTMLNVAFLRCLDPPAINAQSCSEPHKGNRAEKNIGS